MQKKSLLIVFFMILTASLFTSCNIKRNVTGKGLPEHPSHIEFWNGGAKIAEYDNATLRIITYNSEGIVGKSISYYIYSITSDGKTENIVDSESLCIKYTE